MLDYFSLQFRIFNRQLDEFGIRPVWGYLSGVVLFVGLTAYLWFSTSYAPYIYAVFGLSLTTLTADPGKITFILQHFSKSDLVRIRALENLLTVIPFITGLLVYGEWNMAIVTLIGAMLLSFTSARPGISVVIPTPFSRTPFEFPVGFRDYLLALVFAAFLLMMAVIYSNANLGLFACAVVFLICMSFYRRSEPTYLVWIYNRQPGAFLFHKIRNAVVSAVLLLFPYVGVMLLVFPSYAWYVLFVIVLGSLYLVTAIIGKYAFYPSSMNVPQGIVMMMSFGFPPLLIVLIPYFYRQSLRRLQPILA